MWVLIACVVEAFLPSEGFGEKGENAIAKELQQIHDMEGFQPKHWHELTKEERTLTVTL